MEKKGNQQESPTEGPIIITNNNSPIDFLLIITFFRSGSLSPNPDHRARSAHWSAPRRTPPIPRGRLNPIGGPKCSGPAYQHLQEVDSSETDAEAQAR